jgi:glycerol-3-phosphate dehydrogenase (NAD(P)+)
VIAIACGAVIGAGLGESARAALMTRGFAEMVRIGTALGGRAETLGGLSGLGDLALTCASESSRNFAYGLALGRGATPADLAADGRTYEGAATAGPVAALAARLGVEMPLAATVAALVAGVLEVPDAVSNLFNRPLRRE